MSTSDRYTTIGQPVPQLDAMGKVTGLTPYLRDLSVPGMLFGAIVRSPIPHGCIRHIDTSRAERMAGVRAVITARDCPGRRFGPHNPKDWEILCHDKVRYVGDEVAAVAATSPELARAAVAAMRVEYEPLPAVFEPAAALAPGAPVLWEHAADNVASRFHIERGDVAAGFDRADHVFNYDFYTGRVHQGYLEPIGCIAEYHPDGRFTIWVTTHIPLRTRVLCAAGLGVPLDRIRIIVPPFGGSFGAKYELNVCPLAAVLARKAGRPVKIMYEREEDMAAGHPRMGMHFHYRVGVDRDGRFVAKETRVVGTGGARTHWTPLVLGTACHRIDSLYHFQNVRAEGTLAYSNNSPGTCMRGFGNAEACTAMETLIDQIALQLGIDPVAIRHINGVHAGDVTMHGWRIGSCGLHECLDRAAAISGFGQRKPAPQAPPRQGLHYGIGLAAANHLAGNRGGSDFDGATARVRLGYDGGLDILVGDPDVGQGMNTILAQIAAEVLCVSPQLICTLPVDTLISPQGVGTLSSRVTTVTGRAVQLAAEALREQMVAQAARMFGVPAQEIEFREDRAAVRGRAEPALTLAEIGQTYAALHAGAHMVGEAQYAPPTEKPDATRYGNISSAYVFGAHVAAVEVDAGTGSVRVVGYWAVHDSGTVINPATCTGQVQGGVAQGIGSALLEEVVVQNGQVLNPNFMDYRVPGMRDLPEMQVEFVAAPDPNGPFGAKSIGESAINPVAAAVVNAIYNAVGVRIHQIPATPERIWDLLQARTEETSAKR